MIKNIDIRDLMFPNCPVRNVLARVGDKWSILVMYTMQHGSPIRFGQLRKALPDISQKMLTQTLRTLKQDGFVTRRVFAEVPPRVEYQLTERADSFMSACQPMIEWAMNNLATIISDRERNCKSECIILISSRLKNIFLPRKLKLGITTPQKHQNVKTSNELFWHCTHIAKSMH